MGRYVLIRFVALGSDMITIGQFLVTRSVCHDLFSRLDTITYVQTGSRADPEGGQGVRTPPPPKNIGFLSNTGPDPLKNHKAAKPAFNVGPSSARQ